MRNANHFRFFSLENDISVTHGGIQSSNQDWKKIKGAKSHQAVPLTLFLFIKNKRLFILSEGFSTLEKNALICYQRAMLPIHLGSLAPFLFKFKLSG
jgi:hypothetical protein